MIKIDLVDYHTYPEIFEFEQRNKIFFESVLPPRPKTYQNYCSFVDVMDSLISEQEVGDFYMFIIRDQAEKMVGRINLQLSKGKSGVMAEVGYRMDEDAQGKGYASKALKTMTQKAFSEFGVKELIAGTAKHNTASIKVLEKNGFVKVGEEKNVMEIKGVSVDGYLFTLKCD